MSHTQLSGTSISTLKGIAITLFILTIGLCGVHAHAQSCIVTVECGSYSLWYAACIPVPPGGYYGCTSAGPFTANCLVNICVRPCPECEAQAQQPIRLATGDTYITQNDIKVPGLGGGLALSRSWHSIPFSSRSTFGMFGPNWTSSFEESIFVDTGNVVTRLRGDGGVWYFSWRSWDSNGNPYFAVGAPASQTAMLTQMVLQANPNWTLVLQDGETRVYDWFSGRLLSITDRNGNMTSLNYDASARLTSVADPVGRHLYFNYATPSSYLVTSITSDFGVNVQYSYDSQGRLTQVTQPDQTTISYQYDQASRITAVLDSNSKILESHTYNSCGQGLTATRAGGAEAVSVSYSLPCAIGVPAAIAAVVSGGN